MSAVRLAVVGKSPGPFFIWMGVIRQSLSGEDALTATVCCQTSKSSLGNLFSPGLSVLHMLLESVLSADATAGVCSPLTPTLGLWIVAQATPYIEL